MKSLKIQARRSFGEAQRNLKKELSDDGLFPNDAGYAVMAPLAEAAIAQALGKK